MDALEKKLFAQFDDDAPGVRQNALESLREHLKSAKRTFRDVVADLESAMPKAKGEEYEQRLAEFVKANAAAEKREADWQREIAKLKSDIAKLKAALWVKVNWKISGGVAASLLVLVTGYWSYDRYWSRSDAVNAGLRSAVASASWGEGWGEPFAGKIGGGPYWIMLRGDLHAFSYNDNNRNPSQKRLLHRHSTP